LPQEINAKHSLQTDRRATVYSATICMGLSVNQDGTLQP
jgi:hypothetical protein